MNYLIKIAVHILMIAVILLLSCKKANNNWAGVNPSTSPPPYSRIIKARVIEYGSNLPINGASLSICPTPLVLDAGYDLYCPGDYKTFFTDANGISVFVAESIYVIGDVFKEGYFSLDEYWSSCLFEDDTPDQAGYEQTADSFIVRKVPLTYVTVHIKNSIAGLDSNAWFGSAGAVVNSRIPAIQNSCNYPSYAGRISLAGKIDTTFQFPAFGNCENQFVVSRALDFTDRSLWLYSEKIYILKTGNVTVEILY